MIIAIDGPAAAGKGTLAKRLAAHFGLALLDTGLLYRAVGAKAARTGAGAADEQAVVAVAESLEPNDLDGESLRGDAVAEAASRVAAMPAVRAVLLKFQRDFAAHPPAGAAGAVLDGRDIGTVVCPGADVKFFVTAPAEERAKRRFAELQQRGMAPDWETVLADIKARDARDTDRAVAPLRAADDAIAIDTGGIDADAVFRLAREHVEKARKA